MHIIFEKSALFLLNQYCLVAYQGRSAWSSFYFYILYRIICLNCVIICRFPEINAEFEYFMKFLFVFMDGEMYHFEFIHVYIKVFIFWTIYGTFCLFCLLCFMKYFLLHFGSFNFEYENMCSTLCDGFIPSGWSILILLRYQFWLVQFESVWRKNN